MKKKTIGILLMAYGTPKSLDQVEAYYTHIRRGHKPSPEQLQNLINRYQAIGGVSPLNKITRQQATGLEALLNSRSQDDVSFHIYLGMKHCSPFIHEAVADMVDDGIEEAIGFVLAPHYSVMSIGTYIKAAEEAIVQQGGPDTSFIKSWHQHPEYLRVVAGRVQLAFRQLPIAEQKDIHVLFSAHSLPEKILAMGDPYPQHIHETGDKVAELLQLQHWSYAWQSAGRSAGPWLGPDILEVLGTLREQGHTAVISCPIGFVSDHLEVLYDIDIECQTICKELGIYLVRTASLNADQDFLSALASIVFGHMAGEQYDTTTH